MSRARELADRLEAERKAIVEWGDRGNDVLLGEVCQSLTCREARRVLAKPAAMAGKVGT